MPPPRRPSSTARLAAKRAPTQSLQPEKAPAQRTTVRQAPGVEAKAPAPPAPPTKTSSSRLPAAGNAKPGTAATQRPGTAATQKPGTAATQKPGTSSSARHATGRTTSSRQAAQPPSGRHAKSGTSSRATAGSQRGEASSSRRTQARGKRPFALYVVAALVVLAISGALAWKPVQVSMAVSAMDAAKADPTKLDSAMKAADDYLRLTGSDPLQVKELISTGHGPVEAQIHLAKATVLVPQLVSISERSGLTAPQRVAALEAITAVYHREKHATERLPTALADWIADAEQPDEVAAAALALIGRAGRDDAVPTLVRVAGAADARAARADAAMTAMVELITGQTCGEALALLTGPGRDRALANQPFRAKVAEHSSGSVERLIALAFDPEQRVRVFALDTLGEHGSLPDSATNAARRVSLSEKFAPLLDRKGDAEMLPGAIKAAKRLGLSGTTEAMLELAPHVVGLGLNGIGPETLSEAMGRDFILTGSDASKAQSDAVVKQLTAALADAKRRPVAANALRQVSKSELPSVRASLDQLAAVAVTAGDKDCVEALKSLVGQAYGRSDVVKLNGSDAAAWKKWLENETAQAARIVEINAWLQKNGSVARATDDKAAITTNFAYIDKAKAEIDGWRKDPKFLPPLGVTSLTVKDLGDSLNASHRMLRDAKSAQKM